MKLGFSFYGIIYGAGGRTGSDRDFRHCWPGLKRDLIDPFIDRGHEAKIYFSGYPIHDSKVEKEFYELVNPDRVVYSHFARSDPFTAKYAAFNNFMNEDIDAVVFTRSDIHFSCIIANEIIDWNKVNFLFPEGDGWWDSYNFTCDNFYIIPKRFFRAVRDAMEITYKWPRPDYVDTHGLWRNLASIIHIDNMRLISTKPEISDINSFYTCCRSGLPEGHERMNHLHPEVKERFYNGSHH